MGCHACWHASQGMHTRAWQGLATSGRQQLRFAPAVRQMQVTTQANPAATCHAKPGERAEALAASGCRACLASTISFAGPLAGAAMTVFVVIH